MDREIVFDTETTGLSPLTGDRIVEIGCVELVNHVPTGRTFHTYLNPDRSVPDEAFRVHGLTEQFLADKPRFADKADELLAFCDGATMIAHNAGFDLGFINAELDRINRPPLANRILDTVEIAREKYPGARISLDALCKVYGVDTSRRTLHGALLDSEILAEVYLELIGGRQVTLELDAEIVVGSMGGKAAPRPPRAPRPTPLPPRLHSDELAAHAGLIATLGPAPVWAEYTLQ